MLNVLGLLVDLELAQAALLAAGAFASAAGVQRRARRGDASGGTARLEGFE